jgi:hypothetical protein
MKDESWKEEVGKREEGGGNTKDEVRIVRVEEREYRRNNEEGVRMGWEREGAVKEKRRQQVDSYCTK